NFQGAADAMCRLVWYPSAQEQSVKLGGGSTAASALFGIGATPNTPKLITMKFVDMPMQGRRQLFFDWATPYTWPYLTARDSWFRGVNLTVSQMYYNGIPASVVSLQNNLMERSTLSLFNGYILYYYGQNQYNVVQNPLSVSLFNNLFWRSTVGLTYME